MHLSTERACEGGSDKVYVADITKKISNKLLKKAKHVYASIKKRIIIFIYIGMSHLFSKNKIILYASSHNDTFGNISSIAHTLQQRKIKFKLLTQEIKKLSPISFYASLARARVLVIDADSPAALVQLHPKTCLIHCWHAGGAYKKIGFDAKKNHCDSYAEEKRITRIHRCISYFVCSSHETAKIYAKAFRLDMNRMLIFGVPRLDAVIKSMPFPEPEEFTILYAPTFRTRGNGRQIPPPPDAHFLRAELQPVFGGTLRLAFRGHPTTLAPKPFNGWEDWSALPQNEALRRTSILITDYSSILFDYLPFRRPLVFYVPDIAAYREEERDLYFSPVETFSETTCTTEQDLVRILRTCRGRKTEYQEFWNTHMSACDGHATERLCTFIQHQMERS